ncbi:MAG: hypothetical protein DRG63_07660 [Deltaproteobacteria bacterium]|nr:MAG: hypothetical protein DRG63_07660 [Deltaproteobacteria bacterium]
MRMRRFWSVCGIGCLLALFVFCDVALAGRVVRRQVRQQKRIYQGVASGELTYRETRRLEREQVRIQRTKRRAWSDGQLTPRERVHLELMQDKASADIYRLKHNDIQR